MNRLNQRVKRVTHDVGLNQLQVHRLVCNRLTENRMRRRIRRKQSERDFCNYFLVDDVTTIADCADFMQFGDTVAIFVDADIGFNVVDFICAFVVSICHPKERLVSRITNQCFHIQLKPT